MAVQFGKRFRKARDRRQKRRQETIQTFIENRTSRIQARQTGKTDRKIAKQTGKTDRVFLRQQGKSDRIASKAAGGFFLPASVQARQDTLLGVGKAAAGVGLAAAGMPALGLAAAASPFGSGFSTSGFEMEMGEGETGTEPPKGEFEKFVEDNMVLIGIAGIGLLLVLSRRRK